MATAVEIVEEWIARRLEFVRSPLVVGVCGAQGSGKSTLARSLTQRLEAKGISAATFSLDDLCFPKAQRSRLAREVHPLLTTRGPPGTHDVILGMQILDAIRAGQPALLPRFDKACDDRAPRAAWHSAPTGLHVVIFEGWCVGAEPQLDTELRAPINRLEREEDVDGRWRTYVNATLGNSYRALFAHLDRLVLLAAPSFEIVRHWRGQQETELRHISPHGTCVMSEVVLERFIEHYERLTRHILQEMPARADLVLRLSPEREVKSFRQR